MSLPSYIDAAQPLQLLAGQLVCSIDEAGGYYGSIAANGAWCIKKLTSTELLYCFGTSDYDAAWSGRASLTYSRPTVA